MGNLELPAEMSPCLRIFIASLLDDSTPSVTLKPVATEGPAEWTAR